MAVGGEDDRFVALEAGADGSAVNAKWGEKPRVLKLDYAPDNSGGRAFSLSIIAGATRLISINHRVADTLP